MKNTYFPGVYVAPGKQPQAHVSAGLWKSLEALHATCSFKDTDLKVSRTKLSPTFHRLTSVLSKILMSCLTLKAGGKDEHVCRKST